MWRPSRPSASGSAASTAHLRLLGIALLAAAALLGIFHGKLRREDATHPLEERIAAHLGLVVVPVDALALPAGAGTTPVHDFLGLATLARYLQRPILQTHGAKGSVYAVDDESRVYELRAPLLDVDVVTPVRTRVFPSIRSSASSGRARPFVIASAAVAGLMALTIVTSFTASNIVPVTYIGRSSQARTLVQMLPAQCSGLSPSKLITTTSGTSSVTGSNSSELILGPKHAGTVVYNAGAGNDCIVAGGDSRTTNQINGGGGNTICIGAPAAHNSFTNCTKHYN